MYCPNCGKKINKGAKFCPFCGFKIPTANNINNGHDYRRTDFQNDTKQNYINPRPKWTFNKIKKYLMAYVPDIVILIVGFIESAVEDSSYNGIVDIGAIIFWVIILGSLYLNWRFYKLNKYWIPIFSRAIFFTISLIIPIGLLLLMLMSAL